jgi:hypothetical protein
VADSSGGSLKRVKEKSQELNAHRIELKGTRKELMNTFILSFLLLFTIVAAFVFGVALGYWAICGVLYLFRQGRTRPRPSHAPALVPMVSGD